MSGGRVLMIAHHFPPAGGSGSNRALAFARYLPMYGWRPTVVTPDAAWSANADAPLLAEVPRGLRVIRTRSWERSQEASSTRAPETDVAANQPRPIRARHLRSQLGHLVRFPDAHLGWLPFALGAAVRQPYEVAYSSSGPFTSHLIGLLLKRRLARPWVAELRDGWYLWNRAIFPDYPPWRDALERRLESAAVRQADRVVLVTERMAEAFGAQYADLPRDHFAVVQNGFDPAQFTYPAPPERSDSWVLLHAGALYYGRTLAVFLDAVGRVAATNARFARDFHLQLLGTLDQAARAEVARSGLSGAIDILGQTGHEKAIRAMRAANALLLVANTTPGAEATVPSKLFEYLAVGRPVLAIAPTNSSTADVLRQTGGGWLAAADDVDAIACALSRAYAEREARLNSTGLKPFDRRYLTRDLAAVFDDVRSGSCRA
jgi:glycosyltransferase involved in cell wall biosynthesis